MRHARKRLRGLGILLTITGAAGSSGCTHNYYYGGVPACGPTVGSTGVIQNGAVCEVPTQVVGGSNVVAGQTGTAPVLTGPRPPRIVLSQPNRGNRLGWRTADPDSGLATTSVEGSVSDPTTTR